jgi:single-stranded-DNA-specific exonuclease
MHAKRWIVAPPAAPDLLHRFNGLNPLLAQVLINRGIDDPADARAFLTDRSHTNDPFDLVDMRKAVARIRQAIKRREPIVVYGDFDADGVTSTALLVEALRRFNARVQAYIPHRIDEGYGLNSDVLERMAKAGIGLVITVDCGIRSVQEVRDASEHGLDVIVTDHHSLGPELPEAVAVVNPKRDGYPEPMLAGVGVAFKVVQALIMAERHNAPRRERSRPDWPGHIEIADFLDLVAIGTVADLMPLGHLENRVLVRRGLDVLNQARRPGVRALLEVAGVKPGEVSASTIGFALGPRINAAGRLDSAMLAFDLLTAPDDATAAPLAERLQQLNTLRQQKTRDAQELVREQLEDIADPPLIIARHTAFEPGIVGLVAGRLVEEYFRPVVVMEDGDEESRASCRSIPEFDITAALDECADLLVRHGGHALAAGFTVHRDNIPMLQDRLTEIARAKLDGKTLQPTLEIDVEVGIDDLSESLVREFEVLEPCGNGNETPTLMARACRIAHRQTVGNDKRHLKLKLVRNGNGQTLDAIGFGLGERADSLPDVVDIAFQLEINEWNGYRNLQANLRDIRPAEPAI